MYFREAFLQLQLPSPLQIDDFFRSSQQGRRYYGAIISNEAWRPAEMVQQNSGLWKFDPIQNFHIHFEPQFDVLNGILKLYLHYEVYPYQPEAWVRQHLPSTQYDEFVLRRTRFFHHLRGRAPQGWKFGMGYNQIARADLHFENKTFGVAKSLLETDLRNSRSIGWFSCTATGCGRALYCWRAITRERIRPRLVARKRSRAPNG